MAKIGVRRVMGGSSVVQVVLIALASAACGGRSGLEGAAVTSTISGSATSASTGGTVSTGGQANAGATATGGQMITECTGSFDTIGPAGLCVSKMLPILGPKPASGYEIDVTEVTKGQYNAWLATNPSLPAKTDADCGWKTSYEHSLVDLDATYRGADADVHPVENVDWCDAHAYCAGVGKRLCGAIGGGALSTSDANDSERSEWYRACSSGGALVYPYGNDYQSTACNGADYWTSRVGAVPQTTRVGSLGACGSSISGYLGVYDLSGNVFEWEDSCTSDGASTKCLLRGGSLGNSSDSLACTYVFEAVPTTYDRNIGFRCCSL